MEDLTAIIPRTFDFVEDVDDIFDEGETPQIRMNRPSLGKCQSLFTQTNASL